MRVKVENEDTLTKDHKKSKAFQVLCYAYLYNSEKPVNECEAGIISFKNHKEGFMGFKFNKEKTITSDTLEEFENCLKSLILEICDPDIPFKEKEEDDYFK